MRLRSEVKAFVLSTKWIFAKTYASTWPHEYIARQNVDEDLFVELVQHVQEYGYDAHFYTKRTRYFDEDGLVYWTMGAPVGETLIVNRCENEQTYQYRLHHGTLPGSSAAKLPS